MMRKELTVVVEQEGRDKGKRFVLKEMPASQAERWALKVFLAFDRANIEFPEGVAQQGLAGVAQIGLKIFGALGLDEAAPLLDEMMSCVQIAPDERNPAITRALVESDIEEIATRLWLRGQVLKLHTDFFTGVSASISNVAAATIGAH